MFFGTNSPIKKAKVVAIVIPRMIPRTFWNSIPSPSGERTGSRILLSAGSATNPVNKVVTVMPS